MSKRVTVPLRDYFERIIADGERHQRELATERELRYQQLRQAQDLAVQAALIAVKDASASALTAQEKAVTKAETSTEKRFEGVNEFRTALSDITQNQVPRPEYQAGIANVLERGEQQERRATEKVELIASTQDKSTGRAGGISSAIALMLAVGTIVAGLIGGLIGHLLH